MLNLIEKLWSTFKDLHKSEPGELIEKLFLLLVALGGLTIAVFDVVGHPFAVLKDARDVTLVLVGLLGLHFCIDVYL